MSARSTFASSVFARHFEASTRSRSVSFLLAVADDYEQALRETDRLRQDLMRMDAALTEHREHEKNLQNTLTTAQKLSDDIKANAELEAKRIIREAEGRSDLLLERTQARLEDIQREIDGLTLKRKDVETSIEANIMTLRNTLDFVREQEARERDDKRAAAPAAGAAHRADRERRRPDPQSRRVSRLRRSLERRASARQVASRSPFG